MELRSQRGPEEDPATVARHKAHFGGVKDGFGQAIDALRSAERCTPPWRFLRRYWLIRSRDALVSAHRNRWPLS